MAIRLAALALLTLAAPVARASNCGGRANDDICAAGSPWGVFTRFRVELRGDGPQGTTTMTVYESHDFSIDVEDAPAKTGRIIVIGGLAMLMRDVAHESGYEIDALDGPALMHGLVITLLDQAFRKGPSSVPASSQIKIEQKHRAIRMATSSASGRLAPPWTLNGTARRSGGRVDYDLLLTYTADAMLKSLSVAGFWEKAEKAPVLDEHTPIDGWTVHWLGPMASTSDRGTILDYGAKPVPERWADLAALRRYIAEETARRPK
jgi:hypothetical protein